MDVDIVCGAPDCHKCYKLLGPSISSFFCVELSLGASFNNQLLTTSISLGSNFWTIWQKCLVISQTN